MDILPFRQVHLDFHTSEYIDGIGADFDKKEFIDTLKAGHVNSITVFAKCHHGWSYYPSKVNPPHPHLAINLLGEQLEALKEAGIRAPVYISAGHDQKEAIRHPEWVLKGSPDAGIDFLNQSGYKCLCFNSGYLDNLIAQTEEVMQLFNPEEIFYDICDERVCYCNKCIEDMKKNGLDPHKREDAEKWAKIVYANYCDAMEKAVRKYSKTTAIFHNAGNIPMGRRDFAGHDSHLELESLPTGGWGYDHFPMSAAYCRNLGMEYMGMTGKFHTSWGEFGGFKHPNALRYEAALSLAMGAKCSVGDQLHPRGKINAATYNLIGKAYSEVEKVEEYCHDVESVADIAIFSAGSTNDSLRRNNPYDIGANRILLEKKYLYDIIDEDCDFGKYKLLILPDAVIADKVIEEKLKAYIAKGGKVLATGNSCEGLIPGIRIKGKNEFTPSYMEPVSDEGFVDGVTQYVMYTDGYDFECDKNFEVVANNAEPYFNRTPEHFSSHKHAPDRPDSASPMAVVSENIGYISRNIFEDYATIGAIHCKELVDVIIGKLLGNDKTLYVSGIPDRGIVTLQNQKSENRLVNHLLYAHTTKRGRNVEVIEDVVPIYNIDVKIRLDKKPSDVKLVPQNESLKFEYENGVLSYRVPEVYIKQIVVIEK